MKTVLFVCTGNYYRSRFAEALFNHHARDRGLGWRAESRGLAIHMAPEGLSEHTVAALMARAIGLHHTGELRRALAEEDLHRADLAIVLDDTEHRPMVVAQFPMWVERVRFWKVADLDFIGPDQALPAIEEAIFELIDQLAAEQV